jgi:hypothetical protein
VRLEQGRAFADRHALAGEYSIENRLNTVHLS